MTDYNVLSFNEDADHEYDCTCNTPLCNGVTSIPTYFPPTTSQPSTTTPNKSGSTNTLNLMVVMFSFVFVLLC